MNTPCVDGDVKMPRCYTVDEVKQATTLGRTAIYDFIAKGELKSFKLGKRTVVHADDLEAFINAKRNAA
nr:helix-turn-helix domain-containing protein [uncultured Novosphingobium sp.]